MYTIIGGDGKEYGPVPAETIREWITQGRASGQTLCRFENGPLKPISGFPEFGDALRAATPPPLTPTMPGAVPIGGPLVRSSTLSNVGLGASIIGCCCGPFALIGLICSILGLLEINKNPQTYSTKPTIPIIGIVLSAFNIIATLVAWQTGALDEFLKNFPK